MIIAVDKEIPYAKEAFSQFGQIRLFSGRDIQPGDIRDVDALVVRTVTKVNASLLEGSPVRFVGAASAGMDHVDAGYLASRGIHFCYAAGCNANCVSEYIITALHIAAGRKGWDLRKKSLAVIGVGNVGSRVEKKARALGMDVYLCDPPLREFTGDSKYQDFDAVLEADILTFHVPLSTGGRYPTFHMLNGERMSRISPEQFVINSSRGPVVDGSALKSALRDRKIAGAVLDVWEEEPRLDFSLLDLVEIGTPHIAGISLDGKIRATEMIRNDLGAFLNIEPAAGIPESAYPAQTILCPTPDTRGQDAVASVLVRAFDILKKDKELRALQSEEENRATAGFDRLRNQRPLRVEFPHVTVDLGNKYVDLAGNFEALGFVVDGAETR